MICPYCGSDNIKRDGTRLNRHKEKCQAYRCNDCKKYFSHKFSNETVEVSTYEVTPGQVLSVNSKKPLRIHGATDVHHGANEFDKKKFNELIEEVYADPNARWFLNGDNIEFIPPNYKIPQRGQEMEPDDQHLSFVRSIEKIADKLIFIRGGNHDYIRSVNILGFDVSKVLSERLGVPYFMLPGYTKININGKNWNLVSGHGKSGAKNGDTELEKMAAVYSEGDVFFLGHNHQLYAKPMHSLRIENNKEAFHRRWFCRGGSFLLYADYARYSFYPIVRTGWVTMEFKEDEINSWTN